MAPDPRFLKGIEHFNRREFYDAHEVWESLWNDQAGDERRFVQGLIQFATALHHFNARNLKGARILYQGGRALLDPLAGRTIWGLRVKKMIDDMTACMAELIPADAASLPGRYHPEKDAHPVRLDEALLPVISLAPDGARG